MGLGIVQGDPEAVEPLDSASWEKKRCIIVKLFIFQKSEREIRHLQIFWPFEKSSLKPNQSCNGNVCKHRRSRYAAPETESLSQGGHGNLAIGIIALNSGPVWLFVTCYIGPESGVSAKPPWSPCINTSLVEVVLVGPVETAGPGVEPRLGLVHRPLLHHARPPPLRHRQHPRQADTRGRRVAQALLQPVPQLLALQLTGDGRCDPQARGLLPRPHPFALCGSMRQCLLRTIIFCLVGVVKFPFLYIYIYLYSQTIIGFSQHCASSPPS